MSTPASTVINSVRDLVPDPVYSGSGTPLPDTDGGLFRAQTLYRWLSDGIKKCSQGLGWVISDWTALSAVAGQPNYLIDAKWTAISNCLVKKWVLAPIDESLTIFPVAQLIASQPIRYQLHKNVDQITLGVFPGPSYTDGSTTNLGTLTTTATTVSLGSTSTWLPDGYFIVDSGSVTELIKYETKTQTSAQILTRAQGGTSAYQFGIGCTVTHCSIWLKGVRQPKDVTASTDNIELPSAFVPLLQLYVLARCRLSENDYQEGRAMMADFEQQLQMIKSDPYWQSLDIWQVGDGFGVAPLAWGRVLLP